MSAKCVLILLDGLGDRSFAELGHRTPLQAAHTPHLDRLAAQGCCGLYHAGRLGQPLPSENAHFSLFGYDLAAFPGRGALEALGLSLEPRPNDVAVLAHLVSLAGENGAARLVQDLPESGPGEARELMAAVAAWETGGVRMAFHPTRRNGGLFGVLTMRSDAPLDRRVTDSNPMRDGQWLSEIVPWEACADDPAAQRTARALTSYLRHAHGVLSDHPRNTDRAARGLPPINGLVTQRAGQLRTRPMPFTERFGLRGLSIASGTMFRGLAALLGMDVLPLPESGDPEADMAQRLKAAQTALANHDFVHVHTKAPDEAAHTKDPLAKLKVMEALDRGIGRAIGPLLDDPEVLLVITSDHSTPSCGNLVHSGEPVPLAMAGLGVRRDAVAEFNEVSVAAGAWSTVRGTELMAIILDLLDRSRLEGIVDAPRPADYWPGTYRPFRLHGEKA